MISYDKLKRIMPILEWGPKYRLVELQGDLIAGFTVGLTVLPQSIAYASIANVPPQYGLYSAFIGSFVYAVFGGSKDITLGPSAIMSILTATYGKNPIDKDPTYAVVLGFFTGIVQLIMWLVGFGAFCDFISFPVMKAFTTAAAITIGMTQVKKWWGLKKVSRDFIPQLIQTIQKIPETRLWDFLMGVVCIFFIVFFRKIKELKVWSKPPANFPMKLLSQFVWLIGTARNIIVIVGASIVAFIFLDNKMRPFSLIGYIPPGIPSFQTPQFTLYDPKKNVTYDVSDMSSTIGIGFLIVPMVGLIEAMAIGRVFARKFNYKMDPNQEFLSYGIGNLLGAFVMGYPITGTFSRTALNAASGVKTPAGGIVTGALVLIALQFLTPLFYYIPEAALAVVIIMAVLDMMTFHKFWIIWRTRRIDLLPWIVTFILSFILSVEFGIAIGVAVSFAILIYPMARPKVKLLDIDDAEWRKLYGQQDKMNIMVARVNIGLMYPAVAYIKDKVKNKISEMKLDGLILDMVNMAIVDTTAMQGMRELLEELHKTNVMVVACNLQKQPSTMFRRAKPKYFFKAGNIEEAITVIAQIKSGNSLKLVNSNSKNSKFTKNHKMISDNQGLTEIQLSGSVSGSTIPLYPIKNIQRLDIDQDNFVVNNRFSDNNQNIAQRF
ncbi:hypothetical protein HELRODRAFT_106819 [Helobdella robusta]|uniref:STAS domain-containing protein n=1 Tax=Helobdella robusta TaxID=6412 RepID=T1EE52_HELRO|nr:hypothetical protein HELRODRAFT_106819 [Helobdella robusta]ESO02688.1 hypothetical protein HELRODRAFT_106819 [Helobdella robusta]